MTHGGVAARSDLKGGAGWMVFGLAILLGAWRMDRFEAMGATLYTAPGLVPGLFGLALMLLGAALSWRGWRARAERADTDPDAAPAADGHAAEPLLNRRILLMLALTLAYAAGMVGRVPFAPATALFVAAFCWFYAEEAPALRRLAAALLAGVLTAAIVVLVFEQVFLVRLP